MTDFVQVQVEFEREAIGLLSRSDVRAAVSVQTERWRAGTRGFLPETYTQLAPSIDEVALLVALQVVNSDPRRPGLVEISIGPHSWGGLEVPGSRWGINNPDTLYFAAPVEAGSRYVLRGRPTGSPPIDLNVSVQTPDVWGTLDSLGRREISFATDGSFAITVGEELPIRAGSTVLLVRQTLADWTTELPYDLTIELIDGPEPAAPPTDDDRAQQLIDRLGVVIDHSLQTLQPPIFGRPVNTIPQPGAAGDKPGYLVAQRNTLGHFRLADDEALIVVLSPGGAGYAAVAAPNIWGVASDSTRHQNSLNSHQAATDADGRITLVVANVDPGVVNWIDPGVREGILMLRWQLLDSEPAKDQPGVTVRPVRLADLPTILPAAVPRFESPTQRREQLAARAAGYARRFAAR